MEVQTRRAVLTAPSARPPPPRSTGGVHVPDGARRAARQRAAVPGARLGGDERGWVRAEQDFLRIVVRPRAKTKKTGGTRLNPPLSSPQHPPRRLCPPVSSFSQSHGAATSALPEPRRTQHILLPRTQNHQNARTHNINFTAAASPSNDTHADPARPTDPLVPSHRRNYSPVQPSPGPTRFLRLPPMNPRA